MAWQSWFGPVHQPAQPDVSERSLILAQNGTLCLMSSKQMSLGPQFEQPKPVALVELLVGEPTDCEPSELDAALGTCSGNWPSGRDEPAATLASGSVELGAPEVDAS